jgi:type II secretory pathway component PulF
MDQNPVLTTVVYILIALVFISVLTYMFVYNSRLKARRRTEALLGRPPVSKEEGIAVATLEKERAGKTGSIS